MTTDLVEPPSSLRLFGFCLVAALGALLAVASRQWNAWYLLPIAVLLLAVLSFADGFWRARS